jgi:hypothetical protein
MVTTVCESSVLLITRLYLATLNRLSGCDIPERRATLLENLLTTFDIDELTRLLPDDRKQIEELKRLSQIELEEIIPLAVIEEGFKVPVILDFLMEESEAKEVNLALDLIVDRENKRITRSQALVNLARFYLRSCQEPTGA